MKLSSKLNKLLQLSASIFFASHVYADTISHGMQSFNEHQGSYVELNVGSNFYYLGILANSSSIGNDGFAGFGWSGALGYQFHQSGWALEGGLMQNYATVTLNSDQLTPAGQYVKINGNFTVNVPYVTARWEAPLFSRFDFITKVGAMYVSVPNQTLSTQQEGKTYTVSTDGNSIVLPFVSLGLGYAMSSQISAVVQYQGLVLGILGAGLLSAGVDVHF